MIASTLNIGSVIATTAWPMCNGNKLEIQFERKKFRFNINERDEGAVVACVTVDSSVWSADHISIHTANDDSHDSSIELNWANHFHFKCCDRRRRCFCSISFISSVFSSTGHLAMQMLT